MIIKELHGITSIYSHTNNISLLIHNSMITIQTDVFRSVWILLFRQGKDNNQHPLVAEMKKEKKPNDKMFVFSPTLCSTQTKSQVLNRLSQQCFPLFFCYRTFSPNERDWRHGGCCALQRLFFFL